MCGLASQPDVNKNCMQYLLSSQHLQAQACPCACSQRQGCEAQCSRLCQTSTLSSSLLQCPCQGRTAAARPHPLAAAPAAVLVSASLAATASAWCTSRRRLRCRSPGAP
eukprot:6021-Heterococcus_DN1.PRE.2